MAALPHFADAEKAQAWQKLTDLQQHMMGLITAVENQLSLSDSPKLVSDHPAAAVAENTLTAMHSAIETYQQQDQTEACVVTSGKDQQPQGRQTPEQLQARTGDPGIGVEGPYNKAAGSENQGAAAAAADECTAAAADEAACSTHQVGARPLPFSWTPLISMTFLNDV